MPDALGVQVQQFGAQVVVADRFEVFAVARLA
jgi:hypothetical protein